MSSRVVARGGLILFLAGVFGLSACVGLGAGEPTPGQEGSEGESPALSVPDLPILELFPTVEELEQRLGLGTRYYIEPEEFGPGAIGAPGAGSGQSADPLRFGPDCANALDATVTDETTALAFAQVQSSRGDIQLQLTQMVSADVASELIRSLADAVGTCSQAAQSNPAIDILAAESPVGGSVALQNAEGARVVYVAVEEWVVYVSAGPENADTVDALTQLQVDVFTFREEE